MPFKFGVDSSGNYGYIKAGADTVTPFLTRTGNATESQVLSGYTFSNASSSGLTGTMPNINSIDNAISSVYGGGSNGDGIYARMNAGAHITNAGSGYPELFIPQSQIVTAIGLTASKIVKGNTILGLAGTATSVSTVKLVTKTFGAGEPSLNYTTTEAYTVLIAVEHGHTYGGGSLSITGSGVNSLNLINNQMQPETTRVNYCLNAPKGTKVSAYCNGPGGAFIIGIK